MVTLILLGFAALAVYCVSVWRHPHKPCPRCRGRGVNKGSNAKRFGRCRRCAGNKQVQRFGAGAVHRFFWSVMGAALHERRKKQVEKARKRGGYPES